jgi:hypothetical protein
LSYRRARLYRLAKSISGLLKSLKIGVKAELEFLKSLWGLGTEEEEGVPARHAGYIGWRNSFLPIPGPHTRLKIRALYPHGADEQISGGGSGNL